MKRLRSNVVVEGLVFPEGIRWHQGKIWFSDILDFKVYTYDPQTRRAEVVVQTQDRPSGLGFLPDGRLLIATMGERKLLRLDPDGLKVVADLSPLCSQLNDMVVDAQGRAYVDTYFGAATSGGIALVDPGGAYRIVAGNMQLPNGLAVTADGKTLVAADHRANSIVAFDIGPDGSLANPRIFADLGSNSPDGLCLDAAGAAWVGLPFQGKFHRVKQGGEITHEIAYGNKWGVTQVLGGPDRRTLYLCTAEMSVEKIAKLMQDQRDARKECRGWIEVVEGIEVPGAGWP